MNLNELKLKRLTESETLTEIKTLRTKRKKIIKTTGKGARLPNRQVTPEMTTYREDDDQNDEVVMIEGAKPRTPEFVRHCVAAIVEKPADLERLKQGAPEGSDGSPFAVCWAKYNENKRSLAAKHSRGEHHTVAEYKTALKKLREGVEDARVIDRSKIIYSDVQVAPAPIERNQIQFHPKK